MLKNLKTLLVPLLFLSGCTSYERSILVDGIVSNPTVGWNGYTVKVPDGFVRAGSSPKTGKEDRAAEIRKWYSDQSVRYAAEYYTTFYEQFIFEPVDQTFFLSFISETYELPAGWGATSSVEKQYIIQKLINRKMVVINDMKAHSEQIEINGQRGWYISGTSKPYFKKNAVSLAYEGVFLIGNLKEVFWFETFGAEQVRDEMKKRVFEMANTLEVK